MLIKDFEILISSDPDYEDLIAEVNYKGKCLFLVNQEQGFENLEIEFLNLFDQEKVKMNFLQFQEVLSAAKSRLWELRKT